MMIGGIGLRCFGSLFYEGGHAYEEQVGEVGLAAPLEWNPRRNLLVKLLLVLALAVLERPVLPVL